MRDLGQRTRPSKTLCAIDFEPFQSLFVLGPKLKWCGTVPFPREQLLELCLLAKIRRMLDLELKSFLRLKNTGID